MHDYIMAVHQAVNISTLEWYYWKKNFHVWCAKWYGDTRGIVEYLTDYVATTDPESIRKYGTVGLIVIAFFVAFKIKQFLKPPKK